MEGGASYFLLVMLRVLSDSQSHFLGLALGVKFKQG